MKNYQDPSAEDEFLLKRVKHAADASPNRGTLLDFLSEHEQNLAREALAGTGAAYLFYGGYPSAERQRLYVLPPYLSLQDFELYEKNDRDEAFELCVLLIEGSSYRTLTHRDYLGSVLSLGIKRGRIGDILPCDDFSAYLIADKSAAALIIEENDGGSFRVANDCVKISMTTLSPDFTPMIKTEKITDTVPSGRLDAVVSALIRKPREHAKDLIEKGLVSVSGAPILRPDYHVGEDIRVAVRGFGKFRILRLSDVTRKGRLWLEAEKFI